MTNFVKVLRGGKCQVIFTWKDENILRKEFRCESADNNLNNQQYSVGH